ncbi:hypothetical protein NXX23_09645 [Bacteroides ovatus]|nr:hypothetical protein [Bacteroides ovatus]
MVAEMEASADLVLKSESIYIDILKSGGSAPFIGTMMSFPDVPYFYGGPSCSALGSGAVRTGKI